MGVAQNVCRLTAKNRSHSVCIDVLVCPCNPKLFDQYRDGR